VRAFLICSACDRQPVDSFLPDEDTKPGGNNVAVPQLCLWTTNSVPTERGRSNHTSTPRPYDYRYRANDLRHVHVQHAKPSGFPSHVPTKCWPAFFKDNFNTRRFLATVRVWPVEGWSLHRQRRKLRSDHRFRAESAFPRDNSGRSVAPHAPCRSCCRASSAQPTNPRRRFDEGIVGPRPL